MENFFLDWKLLFFGKNIRIRIWKNFFLDWKLLFDKNIYQDKVMEKYNKKVRY